MLAMETRPRRVLLVENCRPIAETIISALTARCCLVETAGGVDTVERILARRRPDLVLIDIDLPEWEGPETVARVRALEPKLPIIAVGRTATENGHLGSAAICGANATLAGPLSAERLLAAIDAALADNRPTE